MLNFPAVSFSGFASEKRARTSCSPEPHIKRYWGLPIVFAFGLVTAQKLVTRSYDGSVPPVVRPESFHGASSVSRPPGPTYGVCPGEHSDVARSEHPKRSYTSKPTCSRNQPYVPSARRRKLTKRQDRYASSCLLDSSNRLNYHHSLAQPTPLRLWSHQQGAEPNIERREH